MVERLARAHGFKQSGRMIRDRIMTLARATAHAESEPGGAVLLWPDAGTAADWDRPRYPASTDDVRAARLQG